MTVIWHPSVTLGALRDKSRNTMIDYLGIELTELGADFLRGTMPVDRRTCQPMRLLHGGASMVLAETLASMAGAAVIDPAQALSLGQEINANHLRSVAEGSLVSGTARPIHLGTRTQVWGVEITNARAQLVCVSRVTMAVVAIARPV